MIKIQVLVILFLHSSCFTISSPNFSEGSKLPIKYTTFGQDVNPQINIEGDLPSGSKSFVLIVSDPDAPNGVWYHWLVKDIPITTRTIQENSVPGKQVQNSWKITNYKGPRPPSGTHRYFFTVFAMQSESIEANTLQSLTQIVQNQSIGQGSVMGTFTKPEQGF